jgi:hypothetical protein
MDREEYMRLWNIYHTAITKLSGYDDYQFLSKRKDLTLNQKSQKRQKFLKKAWSLPEYLVLQDYANKFR